MNEKQDPPGSEPAATGYGHHQPNGGPRDGHDSLASDQTRTPSSDTTPRQLENATSHRGARHGHPEQDDPDHPIRDNDPSFAHRTLRITWAWFPATMSTGSLATLLANQPYTFHGLMTIGKVFYILNLVLFTLFTGLMIARFVRKPRAITTSLHHPSESFFFGAWWVSVALILLGMQVFGGPSTGSWLPKAMRVLFWIYNACALLVAIFQYHVIFHVERLTVSDALPAWILPSYPFLVVGVLAAAIAKHQPPEAALQIVVAGVMGQGLGWIIAFFIYTVYLTRLIKSEMPDPSGRPGMYVSVGPAAYTCAGLIRLGQQAQSVVPANYLGITSVPVGDLWLATSVAAALFLWLIAVWFSALTSLSVARGVPKMSYTPQWWAFVFPNAGLALATIAIGDVLGSHGIKVLGIVITVLLVPLWIMCFVGMIWAVWRKRVLYPGKDLGVDDVNYAHDAKQAVRDEKKGQKKAKKEKAQHQA